MGDCNTLGTFPDVSDLNRSASQLLQSRFTRPPIIVVSVLRPLFHSAAA